MFGFSFSEVVLIAVVTLIAVGPKRLPGLLRDLAKWIRKLRRMTVEVRQQTGIDEMLRAEGLHGGLNELRSLMRGGGLAIPAPPAAPRILSPPEDPYSHLDMDVSREYPPEGPDSKGALPDDLTADDDVPSAAAAPAPAAALPPTAAASNGVSDMVTGASTKDPNTDVATGKANAPS